MTSYLFRIYISIGKALSEGNILPISYHRIGFCTAVEYSVLAALRMAKKQYLLAGACALMYYVRTAIWNSVIRKVLFKCFTFIW